MLLSEEQFRLFALNYVEWLWGELNVGWIDFETMWFETMPNVLIKSILSGALTIYLAKQTYIAVRKFGKSWASFFRRAERNLFGQRHLKNISLLFLSVTSRCVSTLLTSNFLGTYWSSSFCMNTKTCSRSIILQSFKCQRKIFRRVLGEKSFNFWIF